MLEIPRLVKGYLETIREVNLLPFLEPNLDDPESQFWVKVIAQNNEFRARYYFNDIVAFQTIPRIVALYIRNQYWALAIEFIDTMMRDENLKGFLDSIPVDARINYFEQAVYIALFLGHSNAPGFLHQVQGMHGFSINRVYYCAPKDMQTTLEKFFKSNPEVTQPSRKVDEAECRKFKAQLERSFTMSQTDIEASVEGQ